MGVDVDKRVQTTFTVIDRATPAITRISTAMKGMRSATTNSKRMLQAYNTTQAATTRRVTASGKAIQHNTVTTKRATGAQRQFRSSINNVRYSLLGMTAAAASFFAVMEVRKIVKISDTFEQTGIAIAGTLKALGFSKDFESAMTVSAAALEKIRIKAAILPGVASEYVEVFRLGLAGMRGGIKGTLNDIIEFSSNYTALAKSMQVDAPQAGRDLRLMLQAGAGQAGARVKMFSLMLDSIKEFPEYANLTAKAFNKMTQAQRGDVLVKGLSKYKEQIEAAKDTWDAQAGALTSTIELARRLGGKPLFEGMKSAMKTMNDRLMTADGQMLPLMKNIVGIGEAISKGIVGGMSAAAAATKEFYDWTNKAIGAAASMPGFGGFGGEDGKGGASGSAVGAAAGVGAAAMAGTAAQAGIIGAAVAGIIDFASRTEAVTIMFGELSRLGDALVAPFSALATASMLVAGLIGDLLEGALSGFISMVTDIGGPILGFFAAVLNQVVAIFVKLRPTLFELWKSIGLLFKSIGKFLNPIIRIMGTAFMGLFKLVSFVLTPILNVLVTGIMAVVTVFSLFVAKIGSWLGLLADKIEDVTGVKTSGAGGPKLFGDAPGGRDFIKEFFDSFATKIGTGGDEDLLNVTSSTAPTTPTSRGGGGRAINDFRYSRFQINQKFEEGFDPDRIAVAFASDLGKLGETALQSGFEPLFSLQ